MEYWQIQAIIKIIIGIFLLILTGVISYKLWGKQIEEFNEEPIGDKQ